MRGVTARLEDEPPSPVAFEPLRAALLERVDDLASELTELVLEQVPCYRSGGTALARDLAGSCRRSLHGGIQRLVVHGEPGPEHTACSRAVGRRRARQRLPLEAVLRAYRLSGRVMWDAMRREARVLHGGPADPFLLDLSGAVWQHVDVHSSALALAYRAEQARLESCDERERQVLLESLVAGDGDDPAVADDAARALGLQVPGPDGRPPRLLVVVAPLDAPRSAPLRDAEPALRTRGISSLWHLRERAEVGVLSLGRHPVDQVLALLARTVTGRVGASPVVGRLTDVGCAYRLASAAARTLPRGQAGIVPLASRLPEALLASSPEIVGELLGASVAPLLALPPHDAEPLLATLEAVLAHDGSTSRAASALYCHRNTVLYRMRRVEALTGLRTSRARDKLLLNLGVLAARQRGAGRPERWGHPVG